ncbi:MAG: signal peptidase I [Conexivisphaerales archaeon]|jgi:signal peptidase I
MPTRRSKTYSYIFDAVVVFAMIVLIANFGNYFSVVFPVEGISMRPTIVNGDLAIVEPVNINTIHKGDIVVYRDGPIDVIHRVVNIEGSGSNIILTVKGDNNAYPDPAEVTSDLLVGRVTFIVLYLGTFVTEPYNYLLAIVLVSLLVADYFETERTETTPAGSPSDALQGPA